MSAFAFRPVWRTPVGLVATAAEGGSVSTTLVAEVAATVFGIAGQTTFAAGASASSVATVKVNGTSATFTVAGQNVILDAALTGPASIEAILSTAPVCTIQNGTIPPGLDFGTSGALLGTLAFVAGSSTTTFTFTARARHGGFVRDRQFSFIVTPVSALAVTWNYTVFPPLTADSGTGVSSRRLASLDLGTAVVFQPEVIGVGDAPVSFSLGAMTGIPNAGGVFNGTLPAGLSFEPSHGDISGVIAPEASPGVYFFTIAMAGNNAPAPLALSFVVTTAINETVDTPVAVTWVTPAGLLGTLAEGEPSVFGLAATSAVGTPVSYVMLSGSQMPPGLLLDSTTGQIRGRVTSISSDATYTFNIRATSGQTYDDRRFAIAATNRYTTQNVLEFRLRLPRSVRDDVWTHYASDSTLAGALYRPTDVNFGRVVDPFVYLIGGIDGNSPIVLDEYHRRLRLTLGAHKVAVARVGGTGAVLYEVLYREVYDPLDRTYQQGDKTIRVTAGGFSRTATTPVEETVAYPQAPKIMRRPDGSAREVTTIHANSLRNLRLDIIDDFGFANSNALLRKQTGATSVEAMPLWMKSRQDAKNPNSVLGYVPAVVVAYLRPNQGTTVLAALAGQSLDWREGYELDIDRYLVTSLQIGMTTFDGGATTFDVSTQPTKFDTTGAETGKYYNLSDRTGAP